MRPVLLSLAFALAAAAVPAADEPKPLFNGTSLAGWHNVNCAPGTFFVKDGEIHTPIADCFLNGLTRQSVIAIARAQGMTVNERRIMPDELTSMNECFIVGSAAEVTPVAEVGPYKFTPANMSRTLMDAYAAEVRK